VSGSARLVYLYAILAAPLGDAMTGIDQQPIRWVMGDSLAAAVSDVPADEFDEEPLNARVADMAWLGPRAVAHQEANALLFEGSDASLPLAFGTVFRDDERVRHLLTEQTTALTERLARVRGCAEWVVALHLLREPSDEDVFAASPMLQDLRRQIASSSPGRAHLLRRQMATLTRDEARRIQLDAVSRVLDELRSTTADVFQEPLPSDAVEKPLLRASVLVRRADEPPFLDAMDRLRRDWPEPTYRLLLTGPWPPYRFGGLPDVA
jgi:hypothetical protein